MPAKKRKPIAPAAETGAPTVTEPSAPAVSEPDVFDQVIAARSAPPVDTTPAVAAETGPAERGPTAPATAYQPDPFPALSIALGEGADAPRVQLYRNRRMNQVAIRFDEKPAEPVRKRLRDEGYKWREAEGVWTKQLGDQRATGQLTAERLVEEVGNGIRAEAGMAPVGRAVGE